MCDGGVWLLDQVDDARDAEIHDPTTDQLEDANVSVRVPRRKRETGRVLNPLSGSVGTGILILLSPERMWNNIRYWVVLKSCVAGSVDAPRGAPSRQTGLLMNSPTTKCMVFPSTVTNFSRER